MEKTLCQKCFHYAACKAIDLSGALGNPEHENDPCEHYVDAERVKIQDRRYWIEHVRRYSDGEVCVTYRCECGCEDYGYIKIYKKKEWDEYYAEHYRDHVELPTFCKCCGSIMGGYLGGG